VLEYSAGLGYLVSPGDPAVLDDPAGLDEFDDPVGLGPPGLDGPADLDDSAGTADRGSSAAILAAGGPVHLS
jgi:hypothetical protein